MKTREQKQKDLNALSEELKSAKSAMVVGFNKLTVNKDQEFRNQLREAGAKYKVVKNTIAKRATEGTPFEGVNEHFKGVTAIAWTESDAVIFSKTVSKFVKDNADIYNFKVGVVDGKVVNLNQVQAIASLPSKEELISKLLFVINAQAQRLVTVINAVPRNLAVVIKQIGDTKPDVPVAEQKAEVKAEESAPAEAEVTAEAESAPEATATEQNVEQTATPEVEAEKTESDSEKSE